MLVGVGEDAEICGADVALTGVRRKYPILTKALTRTHREEVPKQEYRHRLSKPCTSPPFRRRGAEPQDGSVYRENRSIRTVRHQRRRRLPGAAPVRLISQRGGRPASQAFRPASGSAAITDAIRHSPVASFRLRRRKHRCRQWRSHATFHTGDCRYPRQRAVPSDPAHSTIP